MPCEGRGPLLLLELGPALLGRGPLVRRALLRLLGHELLLRVRGGLMFSRVSPPTASSAVPASALLNAYAP